MKITKHICFYFNENRIKYINNIINETNNYIYITDIYIHTNNENLSIDIFNKYTNGSINIIYHDLSNISPFVLGWKCRDLLKDQMNDYDIFIYLEDDILVPNKAILYWLNYHEKILKYKFNLGFCRIEINNNNEEYIHDITEKLDKIGKIDNIYYCLNDNNAYCAFWIYNKNEFNRFVNSEFYIHKHLLGYGIREANGIGLHGYSNYWYRGTLIPIDNDKKLINDCKIYHMTNNYVNDIKSSHAKIKFNEAIKK